MKTLVNEVELLESNNREVVLTSHRIRQDSRDGGIKHLKSIMLESITGCEFKKVTALLSLAVPFLLYRIQKQVVLLLWEQSVLLSWFLFRVSVVIENPGQLRKMYLLQMLLPMHI